MPYRLAYRSVCVSQVEFLLSMYVEGSFSFKVQEAEETLRPKDLSLSPPITCVIYSGKNNHFFVSFYSASGTLLGVYFL